MMPLAAGGRPGNWGTGGWGADDSRVSGRRESFERAGRGRAGDKRVSGGKAGGEKAASGRASLINWHFARGWVRRSSHFNLFAGYRGRNLLYQLHPMREISGALSFPLHPDSYRDHWHGGQDP